MIATLDKTCKDCLVAKPLDEFHASSHTRDRRNVYCKPCANVRATASRLRRLEAVKQYDRDRYAEAPEAKREASRKRHAAAVAARPERPERVVQTADERRDYLREYGKRPEVRARMQVRAQRVEEKVARANREARRRAVKKEAFVEFVDRFRVWFLGAGRCGICHELVDVEDMHMDHVHPLSKGGDHSYANTQAAHAACNQHKHAKLDYTTGVMF